MHYSPTLPGLERGGTSVVIPARRVLEWCERWCGA